MTNKFRVKEDNVPTRNNVCDKESLELSCMAFKSDIKKTLSYKAFKSKKIKQLR
jgi:hypothetical protein